MENNSHLIYTLKRLYNYMEDRANEEQRNDEYHFLFDIYKSLKELGVNPPDDDKFGIAGKEKPLQLRAFSSDDEIFDTIDPEGKRFNMNGRSSRPELNESIKKLKTDFKRFI
jgi:uncharacterized protein YkuJ